MLTLRSLKPSLVAVPIALLCMANSASAGTKLYYGSIRIVLSTGISGSYSIPFGASISYPRMNNLPVGDLASTTHSLLDAVLLGANQMTLFTGLFTTAPPLSWQVSEARTTFIGRHAAGTFFVAGAPGIASSAPVSGIPASQFGVVFQGGRRQFGGTLALLGSYRSRWGRVYSPYSQYCWDFSIGPGTACSKWYLPFSAIGGAFGKSAFGRTSLVPNFSPTLFDITVWGFPWTTGTVSARAPVGWVGTNSLVRKGSDQRTPSGAGNVQLVTPFVLRRTEDRHASPPETGYQAGIAILDLQFVPEPSAMLALASGTVTLAVLFCISRRAR